MNESLPPDGRRVSYKSLDSEAMAAARRAAEASGISLQEWLSRTILENARRSGIVPDNPSREVTGTAGQASAEEAVQAIARHLERAKSAADTQGLSLAEWLSRAILTNAGAGDAALAHRGRAEPRPTTPPADLAAVMRGDSRSDSRSDPQPAPAVPARAEPPTSPPPRSRPRTMTPAPSEPVLPAANSVRDVLARAGQRDTAAAPPPAAASRRRSNAPLWGTLAVLVLIAGGIWALPYVMKSRSGEMAEAVTEPPKTETAALPGDTKPAEPPKGEAPKTSTPPAVKPPETAKPPETTKPAEPPAATPPSTRPPPPKPSDRADATPTPPGKTESKPAEKPLPDTTDDLAKVPAKDMPKPASAHVDWYRKAADAENAEAQYALAELYLKGDGVGRDYRVAAQLFRRAAEKGNLARAQYALGLLYQRGLGVPKNDVEAVLWWQKAADQSFMPAITWVGLSLLEGRGIQKDEEAARKMLERAAEGDEPNAQYTLGRIYEKGIGTRKDPVMAMKWFILAAEQAHPQATQKVEELSTSLPRDLQERATELVSEHYRRFRKRS